jgi:non-ribosomal peptide synthetase component F
MFSNTISFDAHVLQVFPPLTVGASLVIAKPEGHFDPPYMVDLILEQSITGFMFTVPTLAREYVAELKQRSTPSYSPMRAWGVGGESVPADVVRQMHDVFPNLNPINTYGPTEVTAVAVHYTFLRGFESVVIGKPDANLHCYVVDSELRAVPVGVPGELLLSGPRLALGYAGRPDLTEEKFVPNPCLDLVSGRVDPALAPYYEMAYRTGDLVRWRNDGTIDFLGRIDRQVKITGVRIELGEVESALEGAEGVTGAVAAAVADSTGKQRLVGYITPGSVDTAAVTAHCRALLVPAMVPSVIVSLDAFPLLPNGKVDVRALPAPDWSGAGEEEYVAPVDDAEAAVQRVFAEVLGRSADELSVLADFFAAGGTSLQVFRAAALLQDAFGIASVPATLLHSERTGRLVAAALTKLIADGGGGDAASAAPIPRKEWPDAVRPLSANQEQMWLLSSLAGASAYNMPSALDFYERAPDAKLLQSALDFIAARHEVLRTIFKRQRDGSIAGVVLPAAEFHVPLAVVEASSEEEVVREVAAEAARPFNLETDPLVRARLLLRSFAGGSSAVLALTMHHAVGDAWSQGIFFRELSSAYEAASKGKSPEWPPLTIQYGDYAAWQRDQLTGASGDALRAFWKKTLAGAPAMVQLPQDRPRPSKPTFIAGVARSALPDGLLGKLESVARSLRVNMQAVLLAALQAVLLRYTGQDDLVVGVPVAGRDRQETHGLVGYFINTLPVRCVAIEGASFADMVREASAATLAALDHAALPIEEVVAASGVARVPNANPLFQIIFQYLPDDTKSGPVVQSEDSLKIKPFSVNSQLEHAKMDLSLTLSGSEISADFMAEMFDTITMQRLLSSFVIVLEQLVDNVRAPALAGNLLAAHDALETAKLSMGEERPAYLSAPLVHDAFARAAVASPESRCLCYEGEWLTYGEVSKRVSALAERLASLGVSPGVVVGVMLDRSFELLISILAVFKAGGVYLPCDPSYPWRMPAPLLC